MRKTLTLLCIILLALGFLGGYLFLSEKIYVGNLKIADGQKQLDKGEEMLRKGKARLTEDKIKLSTIQSANNFLLSIPFIKIAKKLPISDIAFELANKKISEGDQMITMGNAEIKAGEARLEEGKLELHHGIEHLNIINKIRIACGILAIVFASLSILLVIYWRLSFGFSQSRRLRKLN